VPEKRFPVKTIQVEYHCDADGCDGQVMFTRKAEPGIDPKNPLMIHICTLCKKVHKLKGVPFPRQEFEPLPVLDLSKN